MRGRMLHTLAHRVPGLSRVTMGWHLAHTAVFLARARMGHVITRFQQRKQKTDDGTVWTTVACRSLIAHPVHRFRSVDAATATLECLRETLDAAGISHAVIVTPPELARVAVGGLSEALRALGQSTHAWYQHHEGQTRPIATTASNCGNDSVLVFQAWASHAGQFLAGADVGVELVHKDAEPQPLAAANFPIDAVITWVDGSDPEWQAKKRARRAEVQDVLHETADNDARYESMDELKYCLRSIEMYAPWIRNIFLVTDNQVPSWLDPADERVTIVDHQKIFDAPTDLPTFNSHAIEARLHHIPDLAEHYVYFNDDLFLARSLAPSFFFTPEGNPRVFLADEEIDTSPRAPTDPPVVVAAKNNREVLFQMTGYRLRHKLKHVPHPQLKSLATKLEGRSPVAFEATASTPFRSPEDLSVASSLIPHYGLALDIAVVGTVRHFYVDTAFAEVLWRLPELQETRGADLICLNTTTSGARSPIRLQHFLRRFFSAYLVE